MHSRTNNHTKTSVRPLRYAQLALLCIICVFAFSSTALCAPKKSTQKPTPQTSKNKPTPKAERTKILNMGLSKDGDTELLCMNFTAARYPELKTLDSGNPRVFFDIFAVEKWEGKSNYPIDGMIIKKVRTGYSEKEDRVRIVMDLNSRFTYDVKSAFDEEKNLFCVGIAIRTILSPKEAIPSKTKQ